MAGKTKRSLHTNAQYLKYKTATNPALFSQCLFYELANAFHIAQRSEYVTASWNHEHRYAGGRRFGCQDAEFLTVRWSKEGLSFAYPKSAHV